ncbi:MAG: ATP synthase F1 subunit delta [Candidatus Methylomirabilales bacterium]
MIAGSVAKSYAKALEEVAAETDALESVGTELAELATLWDEEPTVAEFFSNPGILERDKSKTLRALSSRMHLSPLLARFLDLLLSRDRMQALPAVAPVYRDLVDKRLGRVQATVTTAVPLTPSLQDGLRHRLEQALGKAPVLESRVDPAILGGIVIQVESTVYDGSLRSQLERLREHLLGE